MAAIRPYVWFLQSFTSGFGTSTAVKPCFKKTFLFHVINNHLLPFLPPPTVFLLPTPLKWALKIAAGPSMAPKGIYAILAEGMTLPLMGPHMLVYIWRDFGRGVELQA